MTCVRIEGQANALVQDAGIGLLGQLTHDTTRRLHVRCSGHDGGVVVLPKHHIMVEVVHYHRVWRVVLDATLARQVLQEPRHATRTHDQHRAAAIYECEDVLYEQASRR